MKRFMAFVIKEFRHIIRDKRSLFILIGMPIAQIMLFGFAITNEINQARIAVLDLSQDEISQSATNKLLSSGYYRLERNLQNLEEIEQVFQEGKVKQVIVFQPEFGRDLKRYGKAQVQIISDATDPNTANSLAFYTTSILRDFQQELNPANQVPMQIRLSTRMRFNPELKGVFLFVPGLITVILMLVSAMMTSISITREKESGTMELLLASPMKPLQVIAGKVVPYLLLSFFNAVVILLLGKTVFGVPVQGSLLLLLLETILFIITTLSLGILISTFTNSQQVALLISLMGLMLPTILLSGFIFPIENMPLPLQTISNIIPAKWFIIIIKDIMLKGNGLSYIWKENLILIGFTLFFILVSVRKFKIRLT
jgi:ABC-2 type transport system permease protein